MPWVECLLLPKLSLLLLVLSFGVREKQSISFIFSNVAVESEGFFGQMFRFQRLICAMSCPVLTAVIYLIVLFCKVWAVLLISLSCLLKSPFCKLSYYYLKICVLKLGSKSSVFFRSHCCGFWIHKVL